MASLPDYNTHWKTYAGELENINRRNEGEFASVRARLMAAGAPPDLIKMQAEHFESQRLGEVKKLQEGPAYAVLQEGYGIAKGSVPTPYGHIDTTYQAYQNPGYVQYDVFGGQTVIPGGTSYRPVYNYVEERPVDLASAGMGFEDYFESNYGPGGLGAPASSEVVAKQKASKSAGEAGRGGVKPGFKAQPGRDINPWVAGNPQEPETSLFPWLKET